MKGVIHPNSGTIIGVIKSEGTISCKVYMPQVIGGDQYEGEYSVTPKIEAQTLETRDKLLAQDMVIEGIPCYEVSNPQGGTTFVIGGI